MTPDSDLPSARPEASSDSRGGGGHERLVEQLAAERTRLAAVVDHVPVGIVIAEAPGGRVLLGNATAERIFRHPVIYSENVAAHRDWEAYHPDGRRVEGHEYPLPRAMASGEVVGPEEFRYRGGDGVLRWVRITGVPIRDSADSIVAGLAMVEEIDDAKRAEEEHARLVRQLEVERRRLRTVFEVAPAFMAILRGPEYRFEMANAAYLQLVDHRDVVGKTASEALPEIVEQGFVDLLDGVFRTGERFVGTEVPILLQPAPGGEPEEHVLNFVYEPLLDADGSVSGILAHGVDVTELVRARRTVEEVSRAKSDFLATMSHELRTPLNAMLGYVELLGMGVPEPIPEAARKQVDRIGLSARHLLQLIEEILTFSRIEAGREGVDLHRVDLGEIGAEVRAIMEPLAAKKSLRFDVELPDHPLELETDPRKVRQILLNLLGNAVKFTEQGWIAFRASAEEETIVLEVEDTGPGMRPAELERAFETFWQGESAKHARAQGTGLGLPVTRRLADLLGGTVAATSTLGEGTCFRVTLPRRSESGRPAASPVDGARSSAPNP